MSQAVLVTGAAGFLGSHVSDYLEKQGVEVRRSDIQIPKKNARNWVRADLLDMNELIEATRGVDGICHLGGIGDVYAAERSPELAMLVNAYGTVNLLEAARRNAVGRFIFASTWEVYGQTEQPQIVDESAPCAPTHPYSISKLAGDFATQSANSGVSPSCVVLRLGTAYGARMRNSAVIPSFLARATRGEPLGVHGTGEQFRQFTHAGDIAKAFHLALVARKPGRLYNVVSSERITILQLAQAIASRFGVGLEFLKPRPHDVPSAFISSRLIERELGWRAEVPFDKGLSALIDGWETTPMLPL